MQNNLSIIVNGDNRRLCVIVDTVDNHIMSSCGQSRLTGVIMKIKYLIEGTNEMNKNGTIESLTHFSPGYVPPINEPISGKMRGVRLQPTIDKIIDANAGGDISGFIRRMIYRGMIAEGLVNEVATNSTTTTTTRRQPRRLKK